MLYFRFLLEQRYLEAFVCNLAGGIVIYVLYFDIGKKILRYCFDVNVNLFFQLQFLRGIQKAGDEKRGKARFLSEPLRMYRRQTKVAVNTFAVCGVGNYIAKRFLSLDSKLRHIGIYVTYVQRFCRIMSEFRHSQYPADGLNSKDGAMHLPEHNQDVGARAIPAQGNCLLENHNFDTIIVDTDGIPVLFVL